MAKTTASKAAAAPAAAAKAAAAKAAAVKTTASSAGRKKAAKPTYVSYGKYMYDLQTERMVAIMQKSAK